MKVLFIGVFDENKKSTNTSQLLAFKQIGCHVVGYNYRKKALSIGVNERDEHMVKSVQRGNFSLVVFSKCNQVSYDVFSAITKETKTCLWFMDPLISYNEEMKRKTSLVDYFCCDKENVLEEALKINKNSFHVCEGFDEDVDKPYDLQKEYDVSFIGNIYGNRKEAIMNIEHKVELINGVFGSDHAKAVSKSKINLNFCTSNGASDRVYKILAAGGFLLSDDWKNRSKHFVDGKDLIIFRNLDDLNEKIDFYLKNFRSRDQISKHGHKTVQKFNRLNWAKKILELSQNV